MGDQRIWTQPIPSKNSLFSFHVSLLCGLIPFWIIISHTAILAIFQVNCSLTCVVPTLWLIQIIPDKGPRWQTTSKTTPVSQELFIFPNEPFLLLTSFVLQNLFFNFRDTNLVYLISSGLGVIVSPMLQFMSGWPQCPMWLWEQAFRVCDWVMVQCWDYGCKCYTQVSVIYI